MWCFLDLLSYVPSRAFFAVMHSQLSLQELLNVVRLIQIREHKPCVFQQLFKMFSQCHKRLSCNVAKHIPCLPKQCLQLTRYRKRCSVQCQLLSVISNYYVVPVYHTCIPNVTLCTINFIIHTQARIQNRCYQLIHKQTNKLKTSTKRQNKRQIRDR